ncbi:hypothetical protein QFC20_006101 [Naganishia adeliensis]|uniref:Uncharacterized protein n=1 Tax=Naganishia adeliensis TaxID=92952 RepID=A0ACC2VFP3_9TREE|nr:hypothetical protein QFC20_006101 [Naganishia adeliensis]
MAFRTVMASIASLGSSTINIGLVAAWKGHQQGWFCLLACSLDVLINAFAIYWVTKPGEWSRNAEGLATSDLQRGTSRRREETDVGFGEGTTRTLGAPREKTRPTTHESTSTVPNIDPGASQQRVSGGASQRPIEDKDAYLKPQANVYYPMGQGWATYGDEAPPHTLGYADTPVSPLVVPEPVRLPIARESDIPYARRSSSYGSAAPMQPRVADVEVRSVHGERAGDDREIGFADFLGESEVGLPKGPAEGRRNSQEEEEGKFQKAFFNMLLGKIKMPTSGVGSNAAGQERKEVAQLTGLNGLLA